MFQKQDRIGLVIYLYYNRDARKVLKYGDLHYQSKRSRYVMLYVNKEDVEAKVQELDRLKFVKEVKLSAFDDIDRDFVGNLHRNETQETIEDVS
ncbi:YlbG family protein [Streptococcus phocae subsp. salmonis]|uniref:UPF0298 protein AKK44_06910 n=1 Tax=Streptococcus phocae TaxID=119224 RepID=A0A0N8FX27_9STRE|nr:YlbG family protein [Streptococcus phocae]KGR72374.1 hypothetical protein NX86_06550 [Streptococcus phocae subsp. salmonis]KPJ21963.1 hypothetical protein AKK44_06910 [Streptococcus phocae]